MARPWCKHAYQSAILFLQISFTSSENVFVLHEGNSRKDKLLPWAASFHTVSVDWPLSSQGLSVDSWTEGLEDREKSRKYKLLHYYCML